VADEHKGFARTQIRRGDNKFQGAIRQALHEVRTALAS
jgi:hypothetical protein